MTEQIDHVQKEQCLKELNDRGFTVLPGVLDGAALERIRVAAAQQISQMDPPPPAFDDRFVIPHSTNWSVDVCRAVTHPIAMSIIRTYLATDDIHFCHHPVLTVLRPTRDLLGTFPEMGWHADYPYHRDVFPAEHWQDDAVYGVQYNICIDEFRIESAATQYVPDSHKRRDFPPPEMNEGGTRVGQPPHENVAQMIAPAGAALIYDARTWHRACVELNTSGADRMAILNAVSPNWVRPMSDKRPGTAAYEESTMADQLSDYERQMLHRLCHSETAEAPPGAPHILEKVLVKRG